MDSFIVAETEYPYNLIRRYFGPFETFDRANAFVQMIQHDPRCDSNYFAYEIYPISSLWTPPPEF